MMKCDICKGSFIYYCIYVRFNQVLVVLIIGCYDIEFTPSAHKGINKNIYYISLSLLCILMFVSPRVLFPISKYRAADLS
ncbi:hypothetical protein BDC45DRAFT_510210 [Circinella umbellata]|nr:hypothetical protein BDC45DRAFT_510210 [Circinella umbellata]